MNFRLTNELLRNEAFTLLTKHVNTFREKCEIWKSRIPDLFDVKRSQSFLPSKKIEINVKKYFRQK